MLAKYHFIGIGGIGMSGLARLLLARKVKVTGSDLRTSNVVESLREEGAEVFIGHSARQVSPDMAVVYTTGIAKDNPEYAAALEMKCPMLHRSELLAELMKGHLSLAVAGTHGKTTTSALLTSLLAEGGLDPSFAVGGIIPQLKTNARQGNGKYFVAEACESDGTFLNYAPYGGIITNIDMDHMDFFLNEERLIQSFQTFMGKFSSKEHLFWCGDDPRLVQLGMPGVSYGFGSSCELRASAFRQHEWTISFDIEYKNTVYKQVFVPLTGSHNALNALAAFGLALALGLEEKQIRHGLRNFQGVGRRCDRKGEAHGILLLDDYAHHPTEIQTTLKGIRAAVKEKRLLGVYQPHRYTRTRDCLGSFRGIFSPVDELVVTDIYAAGEKPIPGVTSQAIVDEVRQTSGIVCNYIPRDRLLEELSSCLRPHDVLVTLGAGDISRLGSDLLHKLEEAPPPKIKVGVVFGGLSVEHEVSIASAKNVVEGLQSNYYDLDYFGISKDGFWTSGGKAKECLLHSPLVTVLENQDFPVPGDVLEALHNCDVLFPVLHGPYSEDGTLQGFFEIIGKPYVGCCHRSSAICMDKALTKKLAALCGISTAPFIDFSLHEWQVGKDKILRQIDSELQYPVFVKPLHLGSTVGISKVDTHQGLASAIDGAFLRDTRVLVENGLEGREIEFAVLGLDEIEVYGPGEVLTEGKVYTYDDKYSSKAMATDAKAKLPSEMIEKGKEIAAKVYKAAGCTGMARVDTFLDCSGTFWLNEINPIPGFTKNSLYPKICEAEGLHLSRLADRLICLALARKRLHQVFAKS